MPKTKAITEADGSSDKKEYVAGAPVRVFVDASTSFDDIIRYDQDGAQIYFSEDVPELPDAVVEKLSRLSRIKYQQMLEVKRRVENDDPEWSEIHRGLEISQSGYASPADIAFGNKAKDGFVAKTVREDKIAYWESKGYRMATPGMMKDAKMRQVEGHFQHGTINAPKEYLMVTTEANRDRLARDRDARRKAVDESQVENIQRQAKDAGIKVEETD